MLATPQAPVQPGVWKVVAKSGYVGLVGPGKSVGRSGEKHMPIERGAATDILQRFQSPQARESLKGNVPKFCAQQKLHFQSSPPCGDKSYVATPCRSPCRSDLRAKLSFLISPCCL